MSHVTDGELHLVLDGALDLLPDGEANRVREHLDGCDDCRRRLEAERGLRGRSVEILRGADVSGDEIPPFEALEERAREGGAGDTGGSRAKDSGGALRALAWAASVVLALGVGLYASGGNGPPAPADRGAGAEPDAAPPAAVSERADEPAARSPRERSRESAAAPSRESAETRSREEVAASPPSPGRTGDERTGEVAREGARASRPPPGVGSSTPAPVERSLAVPGLPVLAVAWEEGTDAADRQLVVLQRLPSGDTLSLRYAARLPGPGAALDDLAGESLRARADRVPAQAPAPEAEAPSRVAPLPPVPAGAEATPGSGAAGESVVRVERGPWRLEARAALPADSLSALLGRMPPP